MSEKKLIELWDTFIMEHYSTVANAVPPNFAMFMIWLKFRPPIPPKKSK